MSNSNKSLEKVDSVITEHVQGELGQEVMIVGWVVSVATKQVGGNHFDSNGFAHFTSESFPEYSQLGLLQTVIDDKKNVELAATIIQTLGRYSQTDDE